MLLAELRKLGELEVGDQRTAAFGKIAQADLALERGHLPEANALYFEVLADAQQRSAADPKNPTWQGDLAVSYNNLGTVAVSAGKFDEARAWFDNALAVQKTLAAADPSNTTWQRDLSAFYDRFGDVAMSAGKLDDARGWFDKGLLVRNTLAAAAPSNTAWQRDLAVSYERLGAVTVSAGKLDDARGWFDKALAVRKTLAEANSSNVTWQRERCTTLGEMSLAAREPQEATRQLGEAHSIYGQLQRSGAFQQDIMFAQLGTALDFLAARIGKAPALRYGDPRLRSLANHANVD